MSRRRARFKAQLADLLAALDEAGIQPEPAVEESRLRARAALRDFLLPRLQEPGLPLVVAVIGSTGAGKSTLLNSLAGREISVSSVIRPTTGETTVWASPWHGHRFKRWGRVVVDDHPLIEAMTMVDTPDLDSDLVSHRAAAHAAAAAADAVIMVTSAARYGDASPWEALEWIGERHLAIVLNRLPTRSRGARSDLMSRLRRIGRPEVPVLTISEQVVDRGEGRLRHQAVQRLRSLLVDWTGETAAIREAAFRQMAVSTAAEVRAIEETLRARGTARGRLQPVVERSYAGGADAVGDRLRVQRRRRFWRRAASFVPSEGDLRQAQIEAALRCREEAGKLGIRGELFDPVETVVLEANPETDWRELFPAAGAKFLDLYLPWSEELLARVSNGRVALIDTEYPHE